VAQSFSFVSRFFLGKVVDGALLALFIFFILILEALWDAYGGETSNSYKLLSPVVRVLQGDGIDMYSYPKLLNHIQDAGWSVQNIVCGSGGGLLQKVNRDTLRFAIKANFAIVDGEERAVQKLTATKKSKAGRLTVELKDDKYVTHENGSGSAETNLLPVTSLLSLHDKPYRASTAYLPVERAYTHAHNSTPDVLRRNSRRARALLPVKTVPTGPAVGARTLRALPPQGRKPVTYVYGLAPRPRARPEAPRDQPSRIGV